MDDPNAPATKADVQNLRSEIQALRDELVEVFRDGETRLLKVFYSFAESNQKRLAEIETDASAVKSRLATLENRLLAVEKRLNMPPQE